MESIKKNFIYNSCYQILIIILPLITTPFIARIMGPTGVGIYSYTQSIANYFVLIAMLGVNNYGNRSIANVREDRKEMSNTFWSIYYLQLFLSIILSGLYVIFIIIFVKDNYFIYILQLIYVISAAFDINWFCFGMEKFKLTVTRNTLLRVMSVIAIFLLVKTKEDMWIYTLIMTSSTLISQIVLWPTVLSNVDFIKPDLSKIKKHIKPNITLFLPVIAISLYTVLDKIMLGMMSNITEVGYFTNSERIINIPRGLITALGIVMLPRMSNLVAKGDMHKSRLIIEKSMMFIMFIGSAMTFGILSIAPTFVPWFLGDSFRESAQLASWLSIILLFVSWANVIRTQYLIPNCKDKAYIVSVITGAIVNLIINVTLIPSLNALGAVIGTIFAEASVCIVQTFMVRKELDFKTYFKNGFVFIIIGFVMFIIVRSLSVISTSASITIIVQILVGSILYILLSAIYLIKVKRRFDIINKVFSTLHINYRAKGS